MMNIPDISYSWHGWLVIGQSRRGRVYKVFRVQSGVSTVQFLLSQQTPWFCSQRGFCVPGHVVDVFARDNSNSLAWFLTWPTR